MKRITKSLLSLLLCLSLLTALLIVPVGAADDALSLLVASDTHFEGLEYSPDISGSDGFPGSELYFHTTIQGQMNDEGEAIIRSFLDTFAKSDKKILLISGDLTNGKRLHHENLIKLLKACEDKTGKKIYVINGNHDVNSESTDNKIDYSEFKTMYNAFGYDEALEVDETSCSYTADLNDEYRLIAIDSCIYGKDDGQITQSVYDWITRQVKIAEKDGKKLIGMMHHSILEHFSFQPMISNKSVVGSSSMDFAQALADMGVKYVFTGHIHANDIAGAVSDDGNRIYDVMTGSLITSPNSYREVTFSSENVDMKTNYVTSIDTQYLPKGYNEAQLEMIKNDFHAYSAGFFEAGVARWINEFLGSAKKVSTFFNIEKGTEDFEKLNKLMSYFKDALNLPLYESAETPEKYDSIEEIAESAGATIPKSNYEYLYQPAAKIMGGFFAGDENIKAQDVEVQLVYSVLKSGLAYSLGNMIGSNTYANSVKDLLKSMGMSDESLKWNTKITYSLAKINFTKSVASEIIESVLNPIVEGMSSDKYAPADLNVTLEAYSSSSATPSMNDSPLTIIKKILSFILYFFKIVLRPIIGG